MGRTLSFIALVLGLILYAVYWLRPNWAAALTIFPAWAWLILVLIAVPDFRSKVFKLTCLVWLLFSITFVEEIGSLANALLPENRQTVALRASTINCSGSMEALLAALEEQPDIVLIQETPQKDRVLEWVTENNGYAYAHGIDTGILVRGKILNTGRPAFFYNTAIAEIDDSTYHLTSLRLSTSNPRMDLWNLDCWIRQTQKRERQLEQIKEISSSLPTGEEALTTILGGDFNVPQGDRVFSVINNELVDSFESGGRGWCNTIVNSLPLLRIDQIWTTSGLQCQRAYVKRVPKTDHKMYVAEFILTD